MNNLEDYIDVTDVDLRELVSEAFALSSPQGLGFLHHRDGPLDDATIDDILSRPRGGTRLSMDYVHGRSCKFHVRQYGDRLYISKRWYDHHEEDVKELCKRVGVLYEKQAA